jgi:hypothetical protein
MLEIDGKFSVRTTQGDKARTQNQDLSHHCSFSSLSWTLSTQVGTALILFFSETQTRITNWSPRGSWERDCGERHHGYYYFPAKIEAKVTQRRE